MDKKDVTNRTNQCNPNHAPTGPGHKTGYHGTGTKTDLNNHSNQINPNYPSKKASRSFHQTTVSATLILLKLTCDLCGLLRPWKTLDYYN
ncbi:hypothetical protein WN51_04910 [Melipona quadrifasciata]|uniref:Uncharacterized protein n=1 Tax=Melipona quadrifasciata TaxID=166423 RepID=A0A0M8ZSD2_9HYME|nr:hypothetical protein WN51_04910 [Melipona quadrifasciata]